MNPIRSLLLARHADAERRLDDLRRRVVANLRVPSPGLAPSPIGGEIRSGWRLLWEEVFVHARMAWIGLAVGGLAALALNASGPSLPPAAPRPSPAVTATEVRIERAALWAELHEAAPPPPVAPAPPGNAPRRSSLRFPNLRGLPA